MAKRVAIVVNFIVVAALSSIVAESGRPTSEAILQPNLRRGTLSTPETPP